MWVAIRKYEGREAPDVGVSPTSVFSLSTPRVGRATEALSMQKRSSCKHQMTRFHSIQRLGDQPGLELRQCLYCHTTIAVLVPTSRSIGPSAVAD